MDKEMLSEFNQIKKEMILSYTKFAITGLDSESEDVLVDSVLCSFFEKMNNPDDFITRYDSFMEEDKLIKDSHLFDVAEDIYHSEEKSDSNIKSAIAIYHSVTSSDDYKRLIVNSGYQIPNDFGLKLAYHGDTLHNKISFYYKFHDKYVEIYNKLFQKGVSRK